MPVPVFRFAYCSSCKKRVPEDGKFCRWCGVPVDLAFVTVDCKCGTRMEITGLERFFCCGCGVPLAANGAVVPRIPDNGSAHLQSLL